MTAKIHNQIVRYINELYRKNGLIPSGHKVIPTICVRIVPSSMPAGQMEVIDILNSNPLSLLGDYNGPHKVSMVRLVDSMKLDTMFQLVTKPACEIYQQEGCGKLKFKSMKGWLAGLNLSFGSTFSEDIMKEMKKK